MISTFTLASADPVAHVINHPFIVNADGWWIWSTAQTNMVLSAIILIVGGMFVAKAVSTGDEADGHARWITKSRFAHMIEVIFGYLRDQTIRPLLHERTNKFLPFLMTVFFFILINNLLGLIPLLDLNMLFSIQFAPEMVEKHQAFIGGTATQSIYVTAALSLLAGLMINYAGIRELGVKQYFGHMTGGLPMKLAFMPIVIMVFLIEFAGTFIKPIALAIRLFANMTAGHILVAVLLGFAAQGFKDLGVIGLPVGIVSSIAVIAIYFLELFVAFLQAFVFMFLTTVFISLLAHHGEHETAHDIAEAGIA